MRNIIIHVAFRGGPGSNWATQGGVGGCLKGSKTSYYRVVTGVVPEKKFENQLVPHPNFSQNWSNFAKNFENFPPAASALKIFIAREIFFREHLTLIPKNGLLTSIFVRTSNFLRKHIIICSFLEENIRFSVVWGWVPWRNFC